MTSHEARQARRAELRKLTDELIAEFSGTVPAGTVMRVVARVREELQRCGVRVDLAAATEAAARSQLIGHRPARVTD